MKGIEYMEFDIMTWIVVHKWWLIACSPIVIIFVVLKILSPR